MQDSEVLPYVKAAALLAGLPLDEEAALAAAAHLARTARMANLLDEVALAPGDELAEIYRPMPFPALCEPEDFS